MGFNSQPPEGGWKPRESSYGHFRGFQLTAARRRLGDDFNRQIGINRVSTHSRPKAAGCCTDTRPKPSNRFNSQPPEGGWLEPARYDVDELLVSTHSRPKAAGTKSVAVKSPPKFQLTAARRRLGTRLSWYNDVHDVSTHSRPKAAGRAAPAGCGKSGSFNSQPPEGGWIIYPPQ